MNKHFTKIALGILALTCAAFLYSINRTDNIGGGMLGSVLSSDMTGSTSLAVLNAKFDALDVIDAALKATTTMNLLTSAPNLATVGTITSGTWNGTAIADGKITKTGDWTGTLDGIEGAAFLTAVPSGYISTSSLISGATDEYCLTYESSGSTLSWQTCGTGGGATDQLGQIGDVSTSTLAYGHLLMWTGSAWQDTATSSLGIEGSGGWTFATTSLDYWFNNTAGITGNTNIATLGTITTGVWNGTDIGQQYLSSTTPGLMSNSDFGAWTCAAGVCSLDATYTLSGGTFTSGYHCRYDGTGIDCDRVEDASGACDANAVCMGGHTHVGVNETYGSGWNADTDTPEKDDIYDYLHLMDTDDDGSANNLDTDAVDAITEIAAALKDGSGDCSSGLICLGDHTHSGYITDGNTGWDNSYGLISTSSLVLGATDEYCLTYETGGTLQWQECGTASALASDPSDCSANQFANTIAANGNLTCSAIADADVPNTITASNYLALSTWYATTTHTAITDLPALYTYPAFTIASSTWMNTVGLTASSTILLKPAFTAETWASFRCMTDTGTALIKFGDGTNFMTTVTASTTANLISVSSNNTFTAGEAVKAVVSNIGATVNWISCSIKKQNQ